jgi:gliding motility-associated-like protein
LNSEKIYRTVIILFCLFSAGTIRISGQISSSQADAARDISYPVSPNIDNLYVFFQSNGSLKPGSLSAVGPSSGTFDFTWMKYDDVANDFSQPILTEIGVSSSSAGDLDEGGYRVQVSNGVDVDTSFIAWIMLDKLNVYLEKTAEGKLESYRSGCSDGNFITLSGGVDVDPYSYFDPVSHEEVEFINDFDIQWTSDNPDLIVYNPNDKSKMGANFSQFPPFKDTYYILSATDSLGMTEVDSVLYDTKHTKAEYSIEYYDKIEMIWDTDLTKEFSKDKGSLDAPLTVRFKNESLNGYEFEWVFLDTIDELTGEEYKEYEETFDLAYEPEFTYYNADKFYYPFLVSTSDVGCVDTFSLEDGINVVPSELLIPNVFTPNGDDINPVFRFKHQSIKSCNITISDRFGRVVYRQKIDDIYEWEGWEGTILNTDKEAPEGQYYYVIEATGYDNTEFKDPNYFEQRRLDRQQGGTTPPAGGDGETQSNNLYTGWVYLFRNIGQF